MLESVAPGRVLGAGVLPDESWVSSVWQFAPFTAGLERRERSFQVSPGLRRVGGCPVPATCTASAALAGRETRGQIPVVSSNIVVKDPNRVSAVRSAECLNVSRIVLAR